jgi:hypothetical protein
MTREFIGYVGDLPRRSTRSRPQSEFLFDDGSEEGIKALRIDFPSGKAVVAPHARARCAGCRARC